MGWACIGTGAVVESTTTSITLAVPAGAMDGDLLVACFATRSTATTAISAAGWNAAFSQNNNNVVSNATTSVGSATMLYLVRSGTPPLTFTIPTGNNLTYGRIMVYRGSTATPADFTQGSTTATNITAVSVSGISTSQANELIVAIIGSGRNATMSGFAATTPSGASGASVTSGSVSSTAWTERADSGSNTTPRGALGIFDAVLAAAGSTGNMTCTMSVAGGHAVVSASFKMAPVTGVNVFSGTTGVEKPVKVWSGSAWVPKQAKFWTGTTWKNVGVGRPWGAGGGGGGSTPAYTAFMTRAGSLPTKYDTAYKNIFSSLTTAGFFNASTGAPLLQDGFWIPRTYNEATAYLDLTSKAHNLVKVGSATTSLVFVQNVGWTNPSAGNAALDVGFSVYNTGSFYANNDAHIMVWNGTDGTDFGTNAMGAEGGGGGRNKIAIKDVWESKFYFYMNSISQIGIPVGDCRGLWTISRIADTTVTVYQNTTVFNSQTMTLDFVPILNIYLMAFNASNTVSGPTQREHYAFSIGKSLTATHVSALYSALAQFVVDIA